MLAGKLHVVLDTNIFHKEGLYSAEMGRMRRLAAGGHLQIYVPELVRREYLSHMEMDIEDKLKRAENDLRAFARRLQPRGDWGGRAAQAADGIANIRALLTQSAAAAFSEWVELNGVKLLAFDPQAIGHVMDDYFAGAGVFRKIKSREDFPDAIICRTIETLVRSVSPVHVVVRDAAFRKHLETVQGICVWEDLQELLSDVEIAALIKKLDVDAHLSALVEFASSEAFRYVAASYVTGHVSMLEEVSLRGDEIDGKANIGLRTFGVSINGLVAHEVRDIEFGSAFVVRPGRISVPMLVRAPAILEYSADYQDFSSLEARRAIEIEEVSFDAGISSLRETLEVSVEANLDIEFSADLTPERFEESALAGFTEMSVDFELKRGTILPLRTPD